MSKMTLPLVQLGHISQLPAAILPAASSTFPCQTADHCQGLVGSVAMETESSSKIQNPGGGDFFLMDNVLRWKPVSCGGGGGRSSKRGVTGSEVGGMRELTEAQLYGCGVWGDESRTFTSSVLEGGHGAMLSHGWVTFGECDQEASSPKGCVFQLSKPWLCQPLAML